MCNSAQMLKWKFKNTCDNQILLQNHEFSRLYNIYIYRSGIFKN